MEWRGLDGVKVGDTLYLFDINGRRLGEPEGGKLVTVTKVGRKLVTTDERWGCNQYRIETGVVNDSYGHSWLRTRAQRDLEVARDAAEAVLARLGLRVEVGRRTPAERLIEIAERLKDLEEE